MSLASHLGVVAAAAIVGEPLY
jgi:hypothetical protein